jgi:uncharacterized RDD family membrane protein YckC
MLVGRVNRLPVRTPEGILFSFVLASPMTRFLAMCIDIGCVIALTSSLSVANRFVGLINPDLATAFQVVAYFGISIGYGISTEWYWRGQTLGKRLLRLRVLDEQGLKLHATQIVIRNLLRCIDMLPGLYLVGGLICLCTRRAQRLGDIAANTIVVRSPVVPEPDLRQLTTDKWNSLRAQPHLATRLRQLVAPRTAAVIVDAIVRRQDFDPAGRVHLFQQLAAYLKELVPFPPDVTEGVTDEQYVRNVADVLFR